jgi:hypothetical protein
MSQRWQGDAQPFGDPFFGGGHDPFSAILHQQEQMMNSMMGSMFGGFGGLSSMMGMGHPRLMSEPMARSSQSLPARSSRTSSGPIVEEPDSEPVASSNSYRGGYDISAPSMSSFSSSSFSSSSFSSSSGSGGPVYFQSSTSIVKGPNGLALSSRSMQASLCVYSATGIVERTHSVRDSRSGTERTTMQVHSPHP